MSHDRGWRAACGMTIWVPAFHFEIREIARGVTAMVVGSGALLAVFSAGEIIVTAPVERTQNLLLPQLRQLWRRPPRATAASRVQ